MKLDESRKLTDSKLFKLAEATLVNSDIIEANHTTLKKVKGGNISNNFGSASSTRNDLSLVSQKQQERRLVMDEYPFAKMNTLTVTFDEDPEHERIIDKKTLFKRKCSEGLEQTNLLKLAH